MPASHTKKRTQPDRGANYNALGRDPDGTMAWLVAFFFGPWLPPVPAHVFAGPPEPPRYGHPAQYQMASLPEGFKARFPKIHGMDPSQTHADDYLEPPAEWTPAIFAALLQTSTFEDKGNHSYHAKKVDTDLLKRSALKKRFERERKGMYHVSSRITGPLTFPSSYESEIDEDAEGVSGWK